MARVSQTETGGFTLIGVDYLRGHLFLFHQGPQMTSGTLMKVSLKLIEYVSCIVQFSCPASRHHKMCLLMTQTFAKKSEPQCLNWKLNFA